jgi:hypothetical protein
MNCQSARDVFPALLDARTPATDHLEARAHLAGCPECQREFAGLNRTIQELDTLPVPAPSPRLRQGFYALLEEEKHSAASILAAEERRRESLGWRRPDWIGWRLILAPLAAAALLVLGFVSGQRYSPAPLPTAPAPESIALQQQLEQLRDQVAKMGTLVSYSLLQQQQQPANTRLRGVVSSAALESDDRVINHLIAALAFDSNPNVRLRALDALFAHAEQDVVRAGVLASLGREQNPLVQVSMIDFLAAAQEPEARPTLEKISLSSVADQQVREAARRALTQL